MYHFVDFGIVKKANKALKRIHQAKQVNTYYYNGSYTPASIANGSISSADHFNAKVGRYREMRNNDAKEAARQLTIKPALLSKKENLDFSPTTEQLSGVLNKQYDYYKNYVDNPKNLLVTASGNHTWLTNDGKYMEMPIGQYEMPLDSSMWKGRKSGLRLPSSEIKLAGRTGSPNDSAVGTNLYSEVKRNNQMFGDKARVVDPDQLNKVLINKTDSYDNQIFNKRYLPQE